MSGLLAVAGSVPGGLLRGAVVGLRQLGGDREQWWESGPISMFVTRKAWQLDGDFSGPELVRVGRDVSVAADASLYETPELLRALSGVGVRPEGESASHLIEAAYRAWGAELVRHLNGDYAFVLWDSRTQTLLAARDPVGTRPLYVAAVGDGIGVCSSCRTLALLRGTSADLNLSNLGALVAGLAWSHGADTAYRGIDPLLPGRRLTWSQGRLTVERFWQLTVEPGPSAPGLDEAAEELREALKAAVACRMGRDSTTVWMSGGWDSTAVFAAGQAGLDDGARERLRPVSITYPEGDPGREDDLIQAVARRWGAEIQWIPSESLGLLEGLVERAGATDEPPAHLYELWNRGLARGTRALGAHVTLDGAGGDQLFQVSDVRFADLVASGRWLRFAAGAWARRGLGWRYALRMGLLPLLPPSAVAAAERGLGRRLPRHYLERSLAPWIRREGKVQEELRDRDLGWLASERSGRGRAETETLLYLTMPVWGWGAAYMRRALLDEGVEVRSPLLDPRVVDLALRRPVEERADGRETKLLLRRAMRGLLPDAVLAPRAQRTGVTVGFSRARMRAAYPALLRGLFGAPLRLADLGLVDVGRLRAAADAYLAGNGDDFLRVNLFHTMKVEFWLRGLEARDSRQPSAADSWHQVTQVPAA